LKVEAPSSTAILAIPGYTAVSANTQQGFTLFIGAGSGRLSRSDAAESAKIGMLKAIGTPNRNAVALLQIIAVTIMGFLSAGWAHSC
jgi:hypothetical protein